MWEQALQFGAPIIGGILGNVFGSGDRKRAAALRQQMVDEYGNVDPDAMAAIEAQESGPSSLAGYQNDPGLMDAQRKALAALQSQYESQGMTPTDRLRYEQARQEVARQSQAERQGILQGAAARGSGVGSGDALAAMLLGQQAGADRAMNADLGIAADANNRSMAAAQGMGAMAGNMRNQGFAEARAKADAADEISRFNASQRQNTNVYNQNSRQQNFQNQMQLSGARNNARSGQAGALDNSAQRTADMWYGTGAGVGQGAGAMEQRPNRKKE